MAFAYSLALLRITKIVRKPFVTEYNLINEKKYTFRLLCKWTEFLFV